MSVRSFHLEPARCATPGDDTNGFVLGWGWGWEGGAFLQMCGACLASLRKNTQQLHIPGAARHIAAGTLLWALYYHDTFLTSCLLCQPAKQTSQAAIYAFCVICRT